MIEGYKKRLAAFTGAIETGSHFRISNLSKPTRTDQLTLSCDALCLCNACPSTLPPSSPHPPPPTPLALTAACMTIAKCTNLFVDRTRNNKINMEFLCEPKIASKKKKPKTSRKKAEKPSQNLKLKHGLPALAAQSQLVQVCLLVCACLCVYVCVCECKCLQVRYKSNSCGLPTSHSTKSTCSVQSSCESVQ